MTRDRFCCDAGCTQGRACPRYDVITERGHTFVEGLGIVVFTVILMLLLAGML